jgi:ATP-binding cassette subfamily B protein
MTSRFAHLAATSRWALRLIWSSHARLVVLLIVVMVVTGLLPAATALVMRGLINALVDAAGTVSDTLSGITPWLLLGAVLAMGEMLGQLANRYLVGRLVDDLDLTVTTDILTHAARLDVAFFDTPDLQDNLHRAQRNVANHFTRFLTYLLSAATHTIQAVSLVVVLAVIEPIAALIMVPLAIPHLLFRWRASRHYYEIEHRRAAKRRWSEYFVSLLTDRDNVGEVKLLNLGPLIIARFRALMAEFRDQNRSRYLHRFTGDAIAGVVGIAVLYALLVRVVYGVLGGALTVGDVVAFITAAVRLRSALEVLVGVVSNLQEQVLHIGDLRDFLQVQPGIANTQGHVPETTRGEIAFRDVTFSYPGAGAPALSDVTFQIHPGETVALVGKNGAGKSTLVKLLARFYDPRKGCVLLDGHDVRDISTDYLHREIGFVFQNFIRYEATAEENLAFGDWQRLLGDPEAIERLADKAGVNNLVNRFPLGYQTLLGRQFGDHDPSGGEWQQIAIARALARNSSLVILDEPTSNLDAEAEYEIFTRLRALSRGRTTLLVSHRFSTVTMADRILVLDGGRLVEQGTHGELLEQGRQYAALYAYQRRQMDLPRQSHG